MSERDSDYEPRAHKPLKERSSWSNDEDEEDQIELDRLIPGGSEPEPIDSKNTPAEPAKSGSSKYAIRFASLCLVQCALGWVLFPMHAAILFTPVALFSALLLFVFRRKGIRVHLMIYLVVLAFYFGVSFTPTTLWGITDTINRMRPVPSNATTTIPQDVLPPGATEGVFQLPNIKDANAIKAQDVCPGYIVSEVARTETGIKATLVLAGDACNVYGTDIQSLSLSVGYLSKDRLNVALLPSTITPREKPFYILPSEWVDKPAFDSASLPLSEDSDLLFTYTNSPTFAFSVVRRHNPDDILFTTVGTKLVFENQFIELTTYAPKDSHFYGLGEMMTNFRLEDNLNRTFWANDQNDPIDENIYGSHAILLATRYHEVQASKSQSHYSSRSHGVYLRNAHGMEVLIRPGGKNQIVWRTIGGSIDLYFYSGGEDAKATNVIKTYNKDIGLPGMQQYWAFGYHQCRWGYDNVTHMAEVVQRHRDENIPLETIWLDIDYMDQYRDFTVNSTSFGMTEFKQYLDKLHGMGQKFVPIVDAAIYVPNPNTETYVPFTKGNESDVFLKNSAEPGADLYIGAVWPGYTVFPDWLAKNTASWWTQSLVDWYKDIPFDGIWTDMNEVSSFCVGSCGTGKLAANPVHPPFLLPGEPGAEVTDYPEGDKRPRATAKPVIPNVHQNPQEDSQIQPTITSEAFDSAATAKPGARNVNYPPYALNHFQDGHDLAVHGMSPNATHAGGIQDYELHNLYGHMMSKATYNALLEIKKNERPFIIGRSTFAGTGKWAGHWGGDNFSKWRYMALSIPQALSFSIFGIPFFGVDTCGFAGNTNEELCNRWMQLSAFFPFYRNHNILSANPQEPYVWPSVAEASRIAMNIRYQLLPYWYTLLYQSHTTGSTLMRALAWEFPNDPTLAFADRQFMVGSAIMVTPVLTPGMETVNGVFPGTGEGTQWYDWYTQTLLRVQPGRNVTIKAPLGHIPVFIRGGSIIPLQKPGYTTADSRQGEWSLLVALSAEGEASGELYLDDGVHVVQESSLWLDFVAAKGRIEVVGRGAYIVEQKLANVTVLGLTGLVKEVKFQDGVLAKDDWEFDGVKKVLKIWNVQGVTEKGAWSENWQLSWE